MFGSKNSTDECYKNKRTFECCNICSCPSTYMCIVQVSFVLCTINSVLRTITILALIQSTVCIFLYSNATTASKPNKMQVLSPSQNIITYSQHVLHTHLPLMYVNKPWY